MSSPAHLDLAQLTIASALLPRHRSCHFSCSLCGDGHGRSLRSVSTAYSVFSSSLLFTLRLSVYPQVHCRQVVHPVLDHRSQSTATGSSLVHSLDALTLLRLPPRPAFPSTLSLLALPPLPPPTAASGGARSLVPALPSPPSFCRTASGAFSCYPHPRRRGRSAGRRTAAPPCAAAGDGTASTEKGSAGSRASRDGQQGNRND